MHFLVRAGGLVAALAVADPALAQQGPKHMSKINRISPQEGVPAGFVKWCGADFVCYTGIPLRCTPSTRPYQNIPDHQCFCLRDNCPQ
jgi:hypothetical protein